MKITKILFTAISSFNPKKGGIGRVTDTIVKNLIAKNYIVYYLNVQYQSELHDFDTPAQTFFLPNGTNVYSKVNINYYHQLLAELEIDLVVNQAGNHEESRLFLNVNNNRIKTISTLHSNPILNYEVNYQHLFERPKDIKDIFRKFYHFVFYFRNQKRFLNDRKTIVDFVCRNSNRIVLLSDYFLPELKRLTTATKNVFSIPNPNTFYNVDEIRLENKSKTILFVGRLSKTEKRPDRLLKIWKKIYKDFPDWNLLFVGDGPERKTLNQYIKERSLERVQILGFRDPSKFYNEASILCMTSNFEGWGMVLTESMQYGCVPVSFDSYRSVHEIIIDQKTGLLVNSFDLKQMEQKLRHLMMDEKLRMSIANHAIEHVKQFNQDVVTQKWIQLFETL